MYRQSIISLALLLAATFSQSCSRNGRGPDSGEDIVTYRFTVNGATRSFAGDTLTYRVMLLGTGNIGSYPYTGSSGSYRGPDPDAGRDWLTPCEVVDTSGKYVRDSHEYGLRANRGSYFLTLVSPAVAPERYKWNASAGKYEEWGFLHHREPRAGEPVLSISSPVKMDLKGNHLESQYVYDVPDSVLLKERRSKVTLKIKCGEDLESVTVKKIGWTNLWEEAWYNLRTDLMDEYTVSRDTVVVRGTPLTLARGDAAFEVCSGFYVISADYAAHDSNNNPLYNSDEVPEIDLFVAKGVAPLRMQRNFLPQYHYTFTLTVNSAYVSVDCRLSPWDSRPHAETEVKDEPEDTVTFTFPGWESHTDMEGEI